MAAPRQQVIIKVFRKYSHSLGPDTLKLVEEVLTKHNVEDDELESAVEAIVKEYNKQDDAAMKVSKDVLERVFNSFEERKERTDDNMVEMLDPDRHLHFVDAFDMPLWNWSVERGSFEKANGPQTIAGSPESRVTAARNRLNIIKQSVLRNEHFAPSTLPSRDRERLVTLKSTKQLLGRVGERFLLLGMLAHNKEGKLCVEDADGSVELDLSKLDEPGEGLYTEGCFALVEGEYTEDGTLEVVAMGQPPCEDRATARSIYGHIDFLGKGATSLQEDAHFTERIQEDLPGLNFFFLSDVWLDHPQTLVGIQKIFDNCIENEFIPQVMVLCGNFTSRSISQGNARDIQRYQENFEALAELITAYPQINQRTHFVLVPGPLDITLNSILPRRPLLSSFVSRMRNKVNKIHFASNPCRIKFFGQEIVIFREDTMARMLRNTIRVKQEAEGDDLRRYLVSSILDQSHLSPLTINVQPTLSDFDHSLRLYPLPTVVVLADKYERYKMTYSGCHVLNPGRFVGKSFGFSVYTPAEMNSDEGTVEMGVQE